MSREPMTYDKPQREVSIHTDVGNRLAHIRILNGYTQIEFAALLNTGRRWYQKLERGEALPSCEFLEELHSKFSISTDWLLFGKGEMTITSTPSEEHLFIEFPFSDAMELVKGLTGPQRTHLWSAVQQESGESDVIFTISQSLSAEIVDILRVYTELKP